MTVLLWRIAAVTPHYTADDLSGKGAETTGARWNRRGTPVVYASINIALASLETLAHLGVQGLPLNRYLVRIDVPADIYAARAVLDPLPPGWDAQPYGRPGVAAGEAWLRGATSALLQVPSVLVPEEANLLINPRHPDAAGIRAGIVRRWLYDHRLRQS